MVSYEVLVQYIADDGLIETRERISHKSQLTAMEQARAISRRPSVYSVRVLTVGVCAEVRQHSEAKFMNGEMCKT